MTQVLVSVRFQGYYLELLISKDAAISQLVTAMRQNTFISSNIPDSRLIYRKANNDIIGLDKKVSDLIEREDNSVHYLSVEVIPENPSSGSSSISSSSSTNGSDFFQTQTNRILERIVGYLKEGKINSLLRARQNSKIQATMAENLTSIGQIFNAMKKQIDFYSKSIQVIIQKQTTQEQEKAMKTIFESFEDSFPQDKKAPVIKLCEWAKRMKSDLNSLKTEDITKTSNLTTQTSKISQLQSLKQLNQRTILDLTSQLSNKTVQVQILKRKLQQKQKELQQKQSQLQQKQAMALDEKLNEKENALNQLKTKLSETQRKLTASEKKYDDLKNNLQNTIQTLQEDLTKSQVQVDELSQELRELKSEIEQKDRQIHKLKSGSSSDEQLINQIKRLESLSSSTQPVNPNSFPSVQTTAELIKLLIAKTSAKKVQFKELLYYSSQFQDRYTMKHSFHHYIANKSDLLVVIKSQNDKIFGVFTQETYPSEPQPYFADEFRGISFLFTSIDNQLKSFDIAEGENSLTYDFTYLVFGKEDLMIDFKNNKCTSKFVKGKQTSYIHEDYAKTHTQFLSNENPEQKTAKMLELKIYQVSFD